MPLQYRGILAEHQAVRERAGLFDLSHMAEFLFIGAGPAALLNWSITNDLARLRPGQAQYACLCNPRGGVVDDVVAYCLPAAPPACSLPRWAPQAGEDETHAAPASAYLVVANAANRHKDAEWWRMLAAGTVSLSVGDQPPGQLSPPIMVPQDVSDEVANLAIQGPEAENVLRRVAQLPAGQSWDELKYYRAEWGTVQGVPALVARTGYTGEDGFELYVDAGQATDVWVALLAAGRDVGLEPVGLGARDTLRMEMRYALYGHELDEETTPIEAGLDWVVKFSKGPFVGRSALVEQKRSGAGRQLVGLVMEDRAIPRAGSPLRTDQQLLVGRTTSAGYSPSLRRGMALAYVRPPWTPVGTRLQVEIREQEHPVRVAKTPLVTSHIHR